MFDQFVSFLGAMGAQTGLAHIWWGNVLMIAVGIGMILLAIIKKYEPLLLVGIGFSCIISNVPGSDLLLPGGLFHYAYEGVQLLILPPLIFFGVGAMTDFGPMIANPKLVILGAAAHLGIFVALIIAKLLGFTIYEAGAIGIIGGADGPMAIFMTIKLAPHLLPQISVAAYSYMALMPLIQPPVMKLLTSRRERMIRMKQMRVVTRVERIGFPIIIGILVNLLLPPVAPLITMLMLGNLFKEVLVTDRLAKTAANEIMNIVIVVLTVAIGSTMGADRFLTVSTI
jgi:oxaloacetate decarboxylase beta subunit